MTLFKLLIVLCVVQTMLSGFCVFGPFFVKTDTSYVGFYLECRTVNNSIGSCSRILTRQEMFASQYSLKVILSCCFCIKLSAVFAFGILSNAERAKICMQSAPLKFNCSNDFSLYL